MRHLTLEAIARLVDEAPEPEEALHLRECLVCRRELAEMRAQTEELAQLPDLEPSPGAWAALEAGLQEEGFLRRRTAPREYAPLRAAAVIALLALGGAGGVALRQGGSGGTAVVEPVPAAPRVATVPAPEWERAEGPAVVEPIDPAESRGMARTVAVAEPDPTAEPGGQAPRRERAGARTASRPAEAREPSPALVEAEREYLTALANYARVAAEEDADPVTRLATLEGLVRATRTALERAPGDPVINGYHLAAMGQRDAMLRQIARSSEETWY